MLRSQVKKLAMLCLLLPYAFAYSAQNMLFSDEYNRAMRAYEKGDIKTATNIFSRLAKQGKTEAKTAMGLKYDKGLGVPQNYRKAVKLFSQAAHRNDPIAQYHLGIKYVNGHGVKQNSVEAYIWFAIAFNNGNELAADPLRVLNHSLSTVDRQKALKVVVKRMEELDR